MLTTWLNSQSVRCLDGQWWKPYMVHISIFKIFCWASCFEHETPMGLLKGRKMNHIFIFSSKLFVGIEMLNCVNCLGPQEWRLISCRGELEAIFTTTKKKLCTMTLPVSVFFYAIKRFILFKLQDSFLNLFPVNPNLGKSNDLASNSKIAKQFPGRWQREQEHLG